MDTNIEQRRQQPTTNRLARKSLSISVDLHKMKQYRVYVLIAASRDTVCTNAPRKVMEIDYKYYLYKLYVSLFSIWPASTRAW
jgi:hypothetical protein